MRARPGARAVVAVALAVYLVRVCGLIAGDTLLTYPLVNPDSFDWLTNGLRLTGVAVECTWRSVLNPFVYAALFALRLENAIVFLGPLTLAGLAVVFLTVGWEAVGLAAAYAGLLALTNHCVLTYGLMIGSDVLSITLGFLGLLAVFLAAERDRPELLPAAAAALSLGFLTQASTQFLLPACLVMLAYDPDAPYGVSAGRLRALVRDRRVWAAAGVGLAVPLLAFALRWYLIGVFMPRSTVAHRELVRLSTEHVAYYAWSSLASWSIPVTALATAGAVLGWRAGSRRLTLGLLGAIAGNAGFFAVAYGWRDDRFVLYWTLPVMMLAGMALACLRRPLHIPVLLVALLWGNWTVSAEPSPFDPAVVWSPARVSVMDYYTGAVHPSPVRAHSFTRTLRRWLRTRRRTLVRVTTDQPYYAVQREIIGRLGGAYSDPAQTLYYDATPEEPAYLLYMLKNQLALYARRRVTIVALDNPAQRQALPGRAVVAMRTEELDRLRNGGLAAADYVVIDRLSRYALIRLVPPASAGRPRGQGVPAT